MGLDEKINFRMCFLILTIFYIIFVFTMTWFYPYSFFSLYKSYSWETYEIYSDGKSYNDILDEFIAVHEADLITELDNDTLPNLTINHTVGLLDFFQQDWLLKEEPTRMNDAQLNDMAFYLQMAENNLLDLLVQVDFSTDGKSYLVQMLHHIDYMEKTISEIRQEDYYSRNDLRRNFNNIYGDMVFVLDLYKSFYEKVKTGDLYTNVD